MPKFQVKILLVTVVFILNCKHTSENMLVPTGSSCKLWWLYDERPTPGFICYNAEKYKLYTITRFGKLRKPLASDVIDPLTEHGVWEVKGDSFYLQGNAYSKIKKTSDTVYLRPNVFLIDQTDKFNIDNCDCDRLVALFKGGNIDSVQTILNYKAKRE